MIHDWFCFSKVKSDKKRELNKLFTVILNFHKTWHIFMLFYVKFIIAKQ